MYNDTITLFCRSERHSGDIWYPSILQNVNLNMDKSAILAKYGAESKDNAVLNVRYFIQEEKKMIAGKIWLPPKEWGRQTGDMLPGSLTFTDGKDFDFFMAGEWKNEDPISDDDYTDGFYNYMNSHYDYVFAVTAVGIYSVIPHFEIMGA